MPVFFTSSEMADDKTNDPPKKEWMTYRKHLPSDTNLIYSLYCDTLIKFAGLAESGFHGSMVENTESTKPEVKLIPRKNRDPMDKNSFFKVWK